MGQTSFYGLETKLLNDEDEVVAFFLELFKDESIELVEDSLGIAFPFKDGTFPSDLPEDLEGEALDAWENQELDLVNYKRTGTLDCDYPELPVNYPALLVFGSIGVDGGTTLFFSKWINSSDLET